MTLTEKARREIAALLDEHGRAVVAFSGGKDSVVLADLLQPFRDNVTLVWANTGAMLPHMADFVRSYGDRFQLVEVSSNLEERWARVGVPSRIVPIFNTPLGKSAEVEGERLMLTDWVSCCSDLRMRPIMEYIEAEAFPPLIHGQRRSDNTRGFQINMPRNLACIGVIWEWTDADVWGYIERNGLRLPMQYPELASSFECWNCPASMNPGMYQFLQRHYPERAREYAGILAEVYQTVTREQERIAPMLRAAQGDSSLTRSALPCGGVSFESS